MVTLAPPKSLEVNSSPCTKSFTSLLVFLLQYPIPPFHPQR